MGKRTPVVLLALVLASGLRAQSDRPITELVARHVQVELSLSGAFVDLGGSLGPLGGLAAHKPDASCLSWNPGALPALERLSLVLDWVPGLTQDLQSLFDLSAALNEQMDAIMDEHGAANAMLNYPQLGVRAGLHPLVSGGAMSLPLTVAGRRWGIGFGYREPFALRGALVGTGVEVALDRELEVEGDLRRIRMRTWLDGSAEAMLRAQELYLGFGAEVGPATSVGVALIRLALRGRCTAYAAVEGIVEMSGGEYVFNDPYDPRIDFARGEQNDLRQSFFADYSGSAWSARLGLLHRLSDRLTLGFTATLPCNLRLSGKDSSINNRIPFINVAAGAGEGVEEMIDASKINLAKLTLTERLAQHNAFVPQVRLPASFHLGAFWGTPKRALSARMSVYAGRFTGALKHGEERGVRLRYGGGLGLDLCYFFMALSAEVGDEVQPKNEERAPLRAVPLPRFTVGGRAPIVSGLWLTALLGLEPLPLVRLSAHYEF